MYKIDILYILFLISVNNCSVFSIQQNPKFKVLAVVEITRHGARAPLVKYHKTKDIYFGAKRSQLTINGFRQHILLGRWVRRRYIEGDIYKLFDTDINNLDTSEIKIISSPLQRTIFSTTAHLLGLFPGTIIRPHFIGHPDYRTHDIPPIEKFKNDKRDGKEIGFNVIEDDYDNLFRVHLCKRKGSNLTINNEMKHDEVFKIGKEELQQAIDDIFKNYGENLKCKECQDEASKDKYTINTLKVLVKFLMPLHYHTDVKLNVNKTTLATMKKLMLNRFYETRLNESVYKKLLVSRIFRMIAKFFSSKLDGKNNEKMLLLFGHDFTLMNIISNLFSKRYLQDKILSSLNNPDDYIFLLPPLASSFLFELIEVEGEKNKYLRIIFNGININEGFAKKIDFNSQYGLLDYEQFKSLLISRVDFSYKTLDCKKINQN